MRSKWQLSYKVRYNTIVIWLLFAILTFFVGFRWDVGIDWPAYMSLFGDQMTSMKLLERIEPANLLIKVGLDLTGLTDGGYFLWVMAFITMFFFFYSIKKYSVNPFFTIALFVLLGVYFDLMNGVRQYAAIALTTFSWQFLFEKKMLRYFLVIILASFFHTSAIIMLPVYFVCNVRFNKKTLILLGWMGILLSFITTPIVGKIMGLFPQYEVYGDSNFAQANNALSILRSIFPLSILLILSIVYDKLIEDRITRILTNLSLLYIYCTLFFPGVSLMIRIGFYFQMAFVFLIPMICNKLSRSNRVFLTCYSLIYSFLFISITQLSRPVANILPFELNFRLANGSLINLLMICFISSLLFIYLMRLGLRKQNK